MSCDLDKIIGKMLDDHKQIGLSCLHCEHDIICDVIVFPLSGTREEKIEDIKQQLLKEK